MRLPISRFLLTFAWSVVFLSANAWSGTFTAFGPKNYVRTTGQPVAVTDTFSVFNPNTQYTLHVTNGGLQDDVADFVSSGTITVNGVVIVAPMDLNQNIATLDKPVQLQANNTITVELHGKPGGQLAVQIIGVDNAVPLITASGSPAANAFHWNNSNVVVTFTCADAISGVAICPDQVTVSTEGAGQVISGTATDKAGNQATASVTLNIDKTPPVITVASPANNATVATPTLQLTGNVTDALSGVASISCNSVAALLQAGAFSCSVSLNAGANSIGIAATDVAGNTSTKLLNVTLSSGQPVIADFTPKIGPVGTLITLSGTSLVSGSSTQITLAQQGGGTINAPISAATASSIAFVIPAGAATGAITVTTGGQSATSTATLQVTAASSFTITAGPATATVLQGRSSAYSISVDSADGFTQLAKLSVGGLPSGVTASFAPPQITAGQISILTVTAPAGQPTGNSTLTVTASATVDGLPSTQTANVTLSVQPVTTSFFGRVVESDTIESPLPGIVITFLGVDDAAHLTGCSGRTVADAAGNFIFTNLPDACTGRQLVQYDGLTASDGEAYAGVNLAYTIVKGLATGPELVHLPRIDNAETFMVKQNSPTDQTFTFKTIPGITVTVYAGTIFTLPGGGQPDPFPFTGVEVPVDRLPDTPVDGPGTLRASIVAFQPADTNSNQPVSVTFPNLINTPPGVNMELDTLDPVVGDLVKYGTGTVSGDGTQVVPDPDPAHPGHRYGIQHFDWHGPMSPAPNDINPSPDPDCPTCGDPVDPASGIFVLTKTDVSFGGARGRVEIDRTYRTLSGTPGPFGVGTSHNYGYQLNTFAFIQNQGFITLIMPDGNQFQFIRQPDGTFINTTIPSLKGAVLSAAAPNFALRYKEGTTLTFQNPTTGGRVAYLSSIKDRNGNVTTMVRENPSNPVQITHVIDPVGRQINFTYDNFDRIISITDPIGRVVSYSYNSQGTLATVTDAAGGITRYAYDPQNRLTSIADPRGILHVQNTYDQNGKVIRQLYPDGGVMTYDYTMLNPNASVCIGATCNSVNTSPVLLTTVTDPLGNQTTYHFNAQGFVIDTTDALGEKTVYQREPGTNLVLSMTDPLNRTTAYAYDVLGNVVSVTVMAGTPEAQTTSFSYEPVFSKVASFTNAAGATTSLTYDSAGNLVFVSDPLSHITKFAYDGNGELISTADPIGNKTQLAYSNGALVSITDPLGATTSGVSDAVGRLVSVTTAANQTTLHAYDPMDRLTKTTDPVGGTTAFSYDPNGNLVSVADALGRVSSYQYDAMNRVVAFIDPLSRTKHFQYDKDGNITQLIDRRGSISSFQYDALNRRTASTNGTATLTENTLLALYDAGGRQISVTDSISGTITDTFDGLNRLTSETTPQGSINYSYDKANRRTSMTVVGEPAVSYEYDSAGHITRISQAGSSVSFTYDSANRRASTTLPNGIGAKYVYDNNSRVAEIDYLSGANVLGNITYAYDVLGQRTEIGGSFARTGMPDAVSSATYDDANQLTNWNGLTIKYDADGNILSDGANVFDWNARGQLIGVNKVFAQYDAFGRRTKNFRGTAFIYDGVNAVQELVNGTPAANRLTGGMDEFFSRSDASGTFVPIVDALGSVLALTDGNGILATQYIFDPFGGTSSTGVASTNPFQFTGRENDDVGLYYARARYYNPRLARFMSEDPVGRSASPNLYSYAANSPANFTDPTGKNTATLGYLGGEVAGGIVCFGSGVCEGALIVAGVAVGVAALYYLLKPADNIPGGQVCESRSNPYRGPPGTTSSIPGQDRRYGPDGYPDVDVDYGHDHGQGSPHAHDWDRPANGDPPTHEDRGPGRPVQPSDPKPNSNPNPNSNPKP